MPERSRALLYARAADASGVLSALEGWLRKWDFRAKESVPAGLASGTEVRELYWHPADASSPWMTIAIEDFQNAFHTGWALAKALPRVPVLVSRSYGYGIWQLKAYHDNDCVLKVGDDPDHELPWVGAPLDPQRIPDLVRVLGGGDTLQRFLEGVVAGRPDPRDLEAALRLSSLSHGFEDVRRATSPGWTYRVYVHTRADR